MRSSVLQCWQARRLECWVCGGGRIADSKISLARRACLEAKTPHPAQVPFRSELRQGRVNGGQRSSRRAGEPLDLKRLMESLGLLHFTQARTHIAASSPAPPPAGGFGAMLPSPAYRAPSHPPEAECSRQNACTGSHSFDPSAAMLFSLGCLHALVSVARRLCQGSAGRSLDGGRG